MMRTKIRAFASLHNLYLEELVPKDNSYRRRKHRPRCPDATGSAASPDGPLPTDASEDLVKAASKASKAAEQPLAAPWAPPIREPSKRLLGSVPPARSTA